MRFARVDSSKTLVRIASIGSYSPRKSVSNSDLEKFVENTTDEWIVSHTGIRNRFFADKDETVAFMGSKAAYIAMERACVEPSQIDLIILATTTNDCIFPACATKIQDYLGCVCPAFDIQSVCAGFVFAVANAASIISAGCAKKILVIGSERMTDIINWKDRSTCVLFGDGAGAILLEGHDCSTLSTNNSGIIGWSLMSDGSLGDILKADFSADNMPGFLSMKGPAVFKQAVERLSTSALYLLDNLNMSVDDVDFFIPHQANERILNSFANKLNIQHDKVVSTVSMHANTSAASIPIALDYVESTDAIKIGDLVMLSAIGGGMSWGSLLFRK